MTDRRTRVSVAVTLYVLTAAGWVSLYPVGGDVESIDTAVTVVGLLVAVLIGLIVLRLELLVVEVGWYCSRTAISWRR